MAVDHKKEIYNMKHQKEHEGSHHYIRGRKAAALALGVSLWMAGGGVASAETTVIVESGDTVDWVYNGATTATDPFDNPRPTGEKTDFHTIIKDGGKVNKSAFGGYSQDSNVSGNTVTITGGTMSKNIYGAYSEEKDATYNKVTVSDNAKIGSNVLGDSAGSVYGGYSEKNTASYNKVSVSSGTIFAIDSQGEKKVGAV